jgi:hydrogenase maturation protein HypF
MRSIEIQVCGIVQGVGFRPFVYTQALNENLNGWVNNDDRGVNIALEGDSKNIDNFINRLKKSLPPLSKIDSININEHELKNYNSFEIIHSETTSNKSTIISPDISICDDCISDINNVSNFRYNYSLTNCTNCGPRYSIINTVPYDRCNTSMKKFVMCEDCKEEYLNPLNRRYHAQPVSCEKCGPKISIYDNKNKIIASNIVAIKEFARKINDGHIVALKGMGGFHIVCDATNKKAIEELRFRKNRPTKPFAVMFKDIEELKKNVELSLKEEEIINSKEKPITIVSKKESTLCELIAPNIDRIGCFIAYTPLHILLFKYLNNAIVATSANLSNEPIIRFKDELSEKLSYLVDFVLDFDRDIINACDDSVVQVVNDDLSILRNARGYAPTSMKLPRKLNKKVLALGANQKSTISLAFEDNVILSPHIGDLGSITSIEYFTRTIETFKRFYDFTPDVIVCDKHPLYESSKWAKSQNIELVQIQHHYAHMLSTMAEYKLEKKVLAFCFDGTGYGDDGNIWGGEVFVGDNKTYERVNYFKYFKLLGGEKAVKEPKRVALSFLFDTYSLEEVINLDNETVKAFTQSEIKLLHTVWKKGLNAPLTSSLGRIFDAIASLCGIAQTQSYEGETGLQIEMFYEDFITDSYSYEIIDNQIDLTKCIKQIVKDKEKNLVCSKFINMLVDIIIYTSTKYSHLPVVLTGGVFQNKTLLELVCKRLDFLKKEFYFSKKIPLNDGGISTGQIYSLI